MRVGTFLLAATFTVLTAAAFAQTDTPKGYTGAYEPTPAGAPTAPPFKGPLPDESDAGTPGLDKLGPDGTTKSVRAVPCSRAAHETDGTTTCVGISNR
jgi:hypothetical protein